MVKNLPANAGDIRDAGSIPGLGRSPGQGHGNPLQYSCLENPMDRGAWWASCSSWGHTESDMTERNRSKPSTGARAKVFAMACKALGFPGGTRGKESACQCRRHKRRRFDPWVGKIPWRRVWQPTPVFLSGESHEQRSLAGYSPWGHKELDMTEVT